MNSSYNSTTTTKSKWNNAIHSHMDGPRDYHNKWSKSERERQVSYDNIYMLSLKDKGIYLWSKQTLREQTCGCQVGEVGEGWIGSLQLGDANY